MITERCAEPNHGSLGKLRGEYRYSEPCQHRPRWFLPTTGQYFCGAHYRYHPLKAQMQRVV